MFEWYPRWLDFRGRRYEKQRAAVSKLIENGKREEALAVLLGAESDWSVSLAGIGAVVRDFEQLKWIVEQASGLVSEAEAKGGGRDLARVISAVLELFGTKENFWWGGGLRRKQAKEWVRLQDEIEVRRLQWRNTVGR